MVLYNPNAANFIDKNLAASSLGKAGGEPEGFVATSRYDVFLSHASADKPAVQELARRLRERGLEPWLDVWNLIPGAAWQEAIEVALEHSAACAVCLGPGGTGPWQNAEMRAALSRQHETGRMRVIPVLLPGAERGERSRLPPFLAENTWVEFHHGLDDEGALHRLACGIRGIEPGLGPGEAIVPGASPYRGLEHFRVEDAPFFFGREALIGWLLDKLRPGRAASRLLALVGPSGSGKSSLVHAGLLAALARGEEIAGSENWPVVTCRLGEKPLEDLAVALGGNATELPTRIRDLAENPRMLHLTARLALGGAPPERRYVVVIDPFEPLFTRCHDEAERRAFLGNLLEATAAADGPTVVILTLRSDFLGRAAAYPELAAALSDRQVLVGPMSPAELKRAIERPARLAGGDLEGGLTELLLRDIENQAGSLPLLAHTLFVLWEKRDGRSMTRAAYETIGGVAGALDGHAETAFGELSLPEQAVCRRVFLRLVQMGEGAVVTRRFRTLSELVPSGSSDLEREDIERVVRLLADARLLTTEGKDGPPRVTLAHEALIRGWKRLGEWIEKDRAARRLRDELDAAAQKWLQSGRDPADLYRGARLAQAEEWADEHPGELNQSEHEFLQASLALRDEEGSRERVRAQRFKRLSVGLASVAVLFLFAMVLAVVQWRQVERQSQRNMATTLARQAQTVFETDPSVGLLLSIEAARRAERGGEPRLAAVEEVLRSNLARFGGRPLGPRTKTSFLTVNQRWLVTVAEDRKILVWDLTAKNPAAAPETLLELAVGELDFRSTFALSPDRRWLLTRVGGVSEMHDLRSKAKPVSVETADGLGPQGPFSPDSQWLVSQKAGKVILRNLLGRKPFPLPMSNVRSVTFSADSRWLATADKEGIKLWDLQSPDPPLGPRQVLPGSQEAFSLVFSRDGHKLAALAGSVPKVWSIRPDGIGEEPLVLKGKGCERRSPFGLADLSPDGRWLLAISPALGIVKPGEIVEEQRLCLWAVSPEGAAQPKLSEPGAPLAVFSPDSRWFAIARSEGISLHRLSYLQESPLFLPFGGRTHASPHDLAFSPDTRWLVLHSYDDPPRLWDLERLDQDFEPSRIPIPAVKGIVVSPDGRRVLITRNRNLFVWDLPSNRSLGPVPEASECDGWAFSPEGRWLACGSRDGKVLAWQVIDQGDVSRPRLLLRHRAKITALAFSSDARWLASGDAKGSTWRSSLAGIDAPLQLKNEQDHEVVRALAFQPGGHRLAIAGESGVVSFYNVENGRFEGDLPRGGTVRALAYRPPDGQWLAIARLGGPIVLWKSSQENLSLLNPNKAVPELAWSSDGRWLASADLLESARLQIWQFQGIKTPHSPVDLPAVHASTTWWGATLTINPEDDSVIALGASELITWDLRLENLLASACRRVGRNLTRPEWDDYLAAEEPYNGRSPCPELPASD